MPNLVDVSRTAELFATFVNNPVVVCFVGAIFLVYVMVVVWARRKDIQDAAKVFAAIAAIIPEFWLVLALLPPLPNTSRSHRSRKYSSVTFLF